MKTSSRVPANLPTVVVMTTINPNVLDQMLGKFGFHSCRVHNIFRQYHRFLALYVSIPIVLRSLERSIGLRITIVQKFIHVSYPFVTNFKNTSITYDKYLHGVPMVDSGWQKRTDRKHGDEGKMLLTRHQMVSYNQNDTKQCPILSNEEEKNE